VNRKKWWQTYLIVLTADLPEHRLEAGDIGTVIRVHPCGLKFDVEFVTLKGETFAAVMLEADQVRAVREGEMARVREVGGA